VNERARIANESGAALALSIHADGDLSPGARGFDVIHPKPDAMIDPSLAKPSLFLAKSVRDALAGAGIPTANYIGREGLDARDDLAGLNLTRVPAALVELGNMRSAEEAPKLESASYRARLAAALADGLTSFLEEAQV
jgi:N-acetylmuramoyl-L-alanine amidase